MSVDANFIVKAWKLIIGKERPDQDDIVLALVLATFSPVAYLLIKYVKDDLSYVYYPLNGLLILFIFRAAITFLRMLYNKVTDCLSSKKESKSILSIMKNLEPRYVLILLQYKSKKVISIAKVDKVFLLNKNIIQSHDTEDVESATRFELTGYARKHYDAVFTPDFIDKQTDIFFKNCNENQRSVLRLALMMNGTNVKKIQSINLYDQKEMGRFAALGILTHAGYDVKNTYIKEPYYKFSDIWSDKLKIIQKHTKIPPQ